VGQPTLEEVKRDFPRHLHLTRDISPHAERKVLRLVLEGELGLLAALINFPCVVGSVFHFLELFLGVGSVVFNVGKNVLRNVIEFLDHNLADLLDVLLAPADLGVVVLGLGLAEDEFDGINYVLGDLAVINCFREGFVAGLAPESDEGREFFLVVRIRQGVTHPVFVWQVLNA